MMMRRSALFLALVALMGFAIPAQAQTTLYIGAGASFPTGDFGEFADTGWMGVGGVLFGIGDSGFNVGGEVFYGQNNSKESLFNTKTTPYGIMAIADYTFGQPDKIQPYVFGGLGLMVHRFSGDNFDSESESGFGYQFGAGLAFPFGLFAEGRYMGSSNMGEGDSAQATTYFGALAGWAFDL